MTALTDASTPTPAPASPGPAQSGRLRLRGLVWLVWRQHRATFWTMLAATAVCLAWMIYQRAEMLDYLRGFGWPGSLGDDISRDEVTGWLTRVGLGLSFVPTLIGLFIGAPLFAGDLEKGTAKLVLSQNVSRTRWIAAKLGLSALVVMATTAALVAVFNWWWRPIDEYELTTWTEKGIFDHTGPTLVAHSLLFLAVTAAIGMLVRRTLMAMVLGTGFAIAAEVVWQLRRVSLGDPVTVTTNNGVLTEASYPDLPAGNFLVDQSYITASGELLKPSAVHNAESCSGSMENLRACAADQGVVGYSLEYLPLSQMPTMQWTGAAIAFALTVAVTGFIFFWGRKRML